MPAIEYEHFSVKHIDELANQETVVHRLDPRAKVITTLVFIVTVVSFGKYDLIPLAPFLIYPVVLASLGNIPVAFLFKRILIAAPFAVFVGIFNPFLDRSVYCMVGTLSITGGWVSFMSIMARFLLTVSVALVLIATTGFNAIGLALRKSGVPQVFVVQLLFLYRYIFVLLDELVRMNRARALRTFQRKGITFAVYKQLVSSLLLRSIDRAQRLFLAMQCRGFKGEIHIVNRLHFGAGEFVFMTGWTAVFIIMRFYNIPELLGSTILRIIS